MTEPTTFLTTENTTKIQKDKKLGYYAWDAVPDCIAEYCPAFANCEAVKAGKCSVVREGLRGFSDVLLQNFKESMSADQLWRVGMHLMPLYKMLLKLNIEELGVERVITMDDKGVRRANPVYKELRETLRTIEMTWRTIGISQKKKEIPSVGESDLEGDFENGNPNYVENLEAAAAERTEENRRLIRRRRVLDEK